MARSKAYLFRGVEIRWRCDPKLLPKNSEIPAEESFHFQDGLKDYLTSEIGERPTVVPQPFAGEAKSETNGTAGRQGRMGGAGGRNDEEGFVRSYCNTVPTPEGGTHEVGLPQRPGARAEALRRADRQPQGRAHHRRRRDGRGAAGLVSIFIEQPQFQGQTKEKLVSVEATKLVETVVGDHFEHWLTGDKEAGNVLLEHRHRPGRGAAAAQAGPRAAAQDRDPQAAPARQARRLLELGATAPRSSWSRAIRPAARPSRRATARPRRSCRCAARS